MIKTGNFPQGRDGMTKVEWVKMYRTRTGSGLYDAVQAYEGGTPMPIPLMQYPSGDHSEVSKLKEELVRVRNAVKTIQTILYSDSIDIGLLDEAFQEALKEQG